MALKVYWACHIGAAKLADSAGRAGKYKSEVTG